MLSANEPGRIVLSLDQSLPIQVPLSCICESSHLETSWCLNLVTSSWFEIWLQRRKGHRWLRSFHRRPLYQMRSTIQGFCPDRIHSIRRSSCQLRSLWLYYWSWSWVLWILSHHKKWASGALCLRRMHRRMKAKYSFHLGAETGMILRTGRCFWVY